MVSINVSDVINGNTTILGILGDPIGHSLSPAMHNAAFRSLGWNCLYIPCQVRAADLPAAVRGMRALNFKGVNVTIPHKQAILPELDDIFGDSRQSGSVNTIINRDGKLYGTSTDGVGLVNSIQIDGGFELRGKKVLLLGAGGTATAIIYSLIESGVSKLVLVNRDTNKASSLQQKVLKTTGFEVIVSGLQNLSEFDWDSVDLIIHTTSVGLKNDQSLISKEFLQRHHLVYDVVYKKEGTRLIRDATEAGCQVLSGLSMLLFQGVESFKIWFEVEPPLEIMRQAIFGS
jgi:shikimate dehydrogenase